MSNKLEITLQDLTKIALGAPQLNNVNIAILHSLIEILLKKLNCQNETVSLNANESKRLDNILKTAKLSPLPFNDENVEIITQKLERLDNLQKCVENLDGKLNGHLEELQRKTNLPSSDNLSIYGFEDLCTICDPEHEMACKLLQNSVFLKKLLRRISSPMVERVLYFEEKIERLNQEFTKYIQRAEEKFLKIELLEKCIVELETLQQKMQENQNLFFSTMEEIQDMLDSKLDKIHMPALKKYIRENFERIYQSINKLQDKRQCPKAAGIIMEGLRCVSSGDTKVCSELGIQASSMLPAMTVKSQNEEKHCGCWRDTEENWNKKTTKSVNLGDTVKLKEMKSFKSVDDKDGTYPKCREAGEDFDLLEGFDGNLYRKG